jgi:hypothetical protein
MNSTLLADYLAPLIVDVDDSEKYRVISTAMHNLDDGKASVLGFSGKKGAGKDTMAQYFIQRLAAEGHDAKQAPISAEIKNEAQEMFNSIYSWIDGPKRQINTISICQSSHVEDYLVERSFSWNKFEKSFTSRFNISKQNFDHIMSLVYPLLKKDKKITGLSRQNEVIALLQYLGKDVRQPQDELYWVRKALWKIALNASSGISSLVTDIRYVHDAGSVLDTGGYLVRLDISPEEQAKRLMERDGVVVPPETLNHISETALDNFQGFNIRIDTTVGDSGYTGETIYKSWKDSKNG